MSNASVIRPGLLVSVKSTISGGVSYQRINLDTDQPAEEGKDVQRWETRRVIEDKVEHERATKARSAARALITKCCSTTSFGLLCPNDQEGALDAAIREARRVVDEFNDGAAHTRVTVYALKGRVASDDAEAARAITSEIADLVTRMDNGVKEFDPKKIREAADRARELGAMLSDDKRTKIDAAIKQARAAASAIVRRIEKEGEDRNTVLLDIARGQIESARIAFLDMSGEPAVAEPASPAIDRQRFADLDLSDDAPVDIASQETVKSARERGVLGLDDVEDDAVITRRAK